MYTEMENFRTNLVNRNNGIWFALLATWLIIYTGELQKVDTWQYYVVAFIVGGLSWVPQFSWNLFQAEVLKQVHSAKNDAGEVKRSWIAGAIAAVALIFIPFGQWLLYAGLSLFTLNFALWLLPKIVAKVKALIAKI